MQVRDIMTRSVTLASPEEKLIAAAKAMAQANAGVLPVGEHDRLVGMITDRDIAIRAVAEGRDPKTTKVREIMTADVRYCFEDEEADHVAENMGEQQVRRLAVLDRGKRLVGIVSLGDIAVGHDPARAGQALTGIVRPTGNHEQRLIG
jgi:CBS domain-containing protein